MESTELQQCTNGWRNHGNGHYPVEWKYATDDSATVYYNPRPEGTSSNNYGFRHPRMVKMQYDYLQHVRIEADRTHRLDLYFSERQKDALTATWTKGNHYRRYSVDTTNAAEHTSFKWKRLPHPLHANGYDLKIDAKDPIL
jgi:hypothetical protein